jgi:hypothetical protein
MMTYCYKKVKKEKRKKGKENIKKEKILKKIMQPMPLL